MYPPLDVFLFSAIKLIPPGSIGFLVLCAVISVGLMAFVRSARRGARIALGLLLLSYVFLAVPAVANGLASHLPKPRHSDVVGPPFDAIVVLDGDNRRGRIRTARQMAEAASAPSLVVLADAGDPWIVDNLVASGVPASRITSETGAGTTREQVDRAQRIVASHSWRHVALVASRLQSPRLSALTGAWRPLPTIISAPVDDEPAHEGLRVLVPSYIALRVSRDALYEHAALVYYRWRGWI